MDISTRTVGYFVESPEINSGDTTGWVESIAWFCFLNNSAKITPIKLKLGCFVINLLRIFLKFFLKFLIVVSLRYGVSKFVGGFEVIACARSGYVFEWNVWGSLNA